MTSFHNFFLHLYPVKVPKEIVRGRKQGFSIPVAAWLRGARLVNWLQDIYPETAVELGVPLMRGAIGAGLCRLRDLSLTRAVANVVVGEHMAQRVRSRGVSPDRVHVIPNWSDDEQLCPVGHHDNPLRREWGLERSFVVGYAGNLGRAHEFATVLSAAQLLRDQGQTLRLALILRGRSARDDFEITNLRQPGQDLILNPGSEESISFFLA
jgi:glycosyltransferase involved in cell wall biosynthesis